MVTPADFKCPILYALPSVPVTSNKGHIYDEKAITDWLGVNQSDPQTRDEVSRDVYWPHKLAEKMIQHIKDQKTLSVPKKIIPNNFYGRFKGTLPQENLSVEFIGHIKNRSLNIGSGTDCEVVSYTIRKNGKPVCNYRGFLDNNHIPDRFGQFTIYKDGRIHTKYTGCIANGIPSKDCVIKFSSGYVVGGRINEDGYLSGEGFYANQNDKFYHKGLWCDGKFSATHYKNIHIYFDIFCSFFWKSFSKNPLRVAFGWMTLGAVWSLCAITVLFFDTIIGYLKYTSRMKKELDNIKIEQIVFPYTNPIEIV